MMMLGQIQRPQEPSELNLEDVLNLRRRHPQKQREQPNVQWAIAGGGAVKFLLEATEVAGREIKDSSVQDKRHHKDLEVYLFGEENFHGRVHYPLDLFGVDSQGPLQRINYTAETVPAFGFFIEAMKEFYYGFMNPTEKDIVSLSVEGHSVYSLSPEFLLASKIFHTSGIREGIDDEDAIQLAAKFQLDEKYLSQLLKNTQFSFLEEGIIGNIEELLRGKELYSIVSEEVKKRYASSGLDVEKLTYNGLVSLLDFDPEYFQMGKYRAKVMEILGSDLPTDSPDTLLYNHYLFKNVSDEWLERVGSELEQRNDEPLYRLLKIVNGMREKKLSVGCPAQVSQLVRRCTAAATSTGAPPALRDSIILNITESLACSEFINVRMAAYSQGLDQLARSSRAETGFFSYYTQLREEGWIHG